MKVTLWLWRMLSSLATHISVPPISGHVNVMHVERIRADIRGNSVVRVRSRNVQCWICRVQGTIACHGLFRITWAKDYATYGNCVYVNIIYVRSIGKNSYWKRFNLPGSADSRAEAVECLRPAHGAVTAPAPRCLHRWRVSCTVRRYRVVWMGRPFAVPHVKFEALRPIAPRWQTRWRQHGPFGGTLARIFGPRIWRGRRTPLPASVYDFEVTYLLDQFFGMMQNPIGNVNANPDNGMINFADAFHHAYLLSPHILLTVNDLTITVLADVNSYLYAAYDSHEK